MTTNKSKLLEKVLSKYRVWDIAYAEFEGHSKEKREGANQFVVSINAVNEMEDEARTDTANQIFDKLDKMLPIDRCKCGHDKSDHDDMLSCDKCGCIEYEVNDFIEEYFNLQQYLR